MLYQLILHRGNGKQLKKLWVTKIPFICKTLGSGWGFPGAASGKEPACQCREIWDTGLIPRKIPWRRAWQLTPVFFPGESHGQRSLATVHSQTWLKQLSTGYGYGRQTSKFVGSGHCWCLTSIPCMRMVCLHPVAMSLGNQRLTAAPFSRKCPKSVGASMSRTRGSSPWI